MAQKKTVHTIQTLHDRCIEEGECWNWTGYFANGCPYVNHAGKVQAVRKVMSFLSGKQPMPGAKFFAASCGNSQCVNPAHVVSRSASIHGTAMAKKVNHLAIPRLIKLQKVSRARKASKLTRELADQIFADDRCNRRIADDYKISASMVSNIKLGKSWKNLSATTNPWVSLMR
jgi:hypothetical protein